MFCMFVYFIQYVLENQNLYKTEGSAQFCFTETKIKVVKRLLCVCVCVCVHTIYTRTIIAVCKECVVLLQAYTVHWCDTIYNRTNRRKISLPLPNICQKSIHIKGDFLFLLLLLFFFLFFSQNAKNFSVTVNCSTRSC